MALDLRSVREICVLFERSAAHLSARHHHPTLFEALKAQSSAQNSYQAVQFNAMKQRSAMDLAVSDPSHY